ncbi:MAG: S-adenosylmethionine:tRNA ribosyltransferase-isomerase [candidate division WS6 bacterium GW2011_GWF2_39_15]|uniref:S-adenosylmethionine:tRNA ribosyltransferase-isomerase n=1 Tax=candidate division WS6 bacterium GW2011_GWF2_39_15 TaxID=1619100 RepID=A0A0G0QVN8_9BACT|nr:MAG: S-adenosylmethionine:tRNA ribosyltransferase-isomerase [candidate division WS6 bacterium GW2011_GWF2_39_15]
MKLSQFEYNLPEDRIAKFPPKVRGTTNLMVLNRDSQSIDHKKYADIPDYIKPGDVLVLNNTKVERVRVFLFNPRNEKRVEAIFLNKVCRGTDEAIEYWECILGRAKHVTEGDKLKSFLNDDNYIEVEGKISDGIFLVSSRKGKIDSFFQSEGHIPLPPYLHREDSEEDRVRYNTVFAKYIGSAAAPTAGLNVTEDLLNKLTNKGVKVVEVKLNVGWGTFAPIRTENIEDHKIHSERIEVTKQAADEINEVIKSGGDIWVLGTTAARTLESVAYKDKESDRYFVKEYEGDTNIYIYPGYEWKVVNHMITNFHAPKSSLVVMISAFAGYDFIMKGYNTAIEKKYNFLSYGDSMLII